MNNIEILEDLKKYISFANKQCNFSNDADYKWHKELAGMIENLIQENKELKEKMNFIHINNLNDIYEETLEKTFTKFIKSNIEKDYIPKIKVKEKIEELEKQAEEVKIHYKGTYACLDEYMNAKSKIQGFKELLEEGE